MNFLSFFTRPGDKHDEKISNCPQVTQAHYELTSSFSLSSDYISDLLGTV